MLLKSAFCAARTGHLPVAGQLRPTPVAAELPEGRPCKFLDSSATLLPHEERFLDSSWADKP